MYDIRFVVEEVVRDFIIYVTKETTTKHGCCSVPIPIKRGMH